MLKVCSKNKFIENMVNIKQIICFGAGKRIEVLKSFIKGQI